MHVSSYMLLLLYFFNISESNLQPISKTHIEVYESLTKCIVQCIGNYISSSFERVMYNLQTIENVTSYLELKTLEEILLPTIANYLNKDIVIYTVNGPIRDFGQVQKFGTFIIHFNDQNDLQNHIDTLKLSGILNTRARFLLFSTVSHKNRYTVTMKISQYLWTENIFDSVIILETKLGKTFGITSWNPYQNKNLGQNFERGSRIHAKCSFGVINKDIDWFGNKIPKTLEKFEFKVHYLNRPPYVIVSEQKYISQIKLQKGIEIKLISTIAEALKFKIVYPNLKNNELGGITSNNTFTGVFQFFITKELDIAIGGYAKTPKVSEMLDSSRPYIQDSIIWCVPHVSAITTVEKVFNVLKPHTAITLLVIQGIISLIINYSSRKDENELRYYISFQNTFMDIFTSMNSPVPHIPRTRRVRELLGLYMFFGFIFGIAYNSCLISNLTNPDFKEKYSSLVAVYENDLKTYFSPGFLFLFSSIQEINGVSTSRIRSKWINCKCINECLQLVAFNEDSSICFSQLFAKYYSNYEVKRNIFCLSDSKINYHINIVMRKGFPIYNQIDKVISKLVTGGFIRKWEADSYSKMKINMDISKTVDLTELLFVFQILFITQLLCFVVLILEIIVHNRNTKNNKN